MIDWATARPEVDPLLGSSMGGELAPRAAAFDPRISALICIDGVCDVDRSYTGRLTFGDDAERRLRAETDDALPAAGPSPASSSAASRKR